VDTHIAIWLHAGLTEKLSQEAQRQIDKCDLLISPMVYQLDYMFRRGRVRYEPSRVFADLSGTFGITMCPFPFPAIVVAAVDFAWTNDPFDRLIVAHAKANQNSKLISADETIRQNYGYSVW